MNDTSIAESNGTGAVARLIALAIAIAAAVLAWFVISDDLGKPVTVANETGSPPAMLRQLEQPSNPGCIETRTAEINRLESDGLMSKEAADLSRTRIASHCENGT